MKNDIWCENPPSQCSQWNLGVFRSESTTPNENREKSQIYVLEWIKVIRNGREYHFPLYTFIIKCLMLITGILSSALSLPLTPPHFVVCFAACKLVSIKPNRKINIERKMWERAGEGSASKRYEILHLSIASWAWTLNMEHTNEYTKTIPLYGAINVFRDKCTKKQKSMFHRF